MSKTITHNRLARSEMLSFLLPTRNRARYVEKCLLSIFDEIDKDYPNAEVIVIDGGSTDGTVNVLEKYESRIHYWISEPDSGISEAVNKGLKVCRGDVVRLIGDDDEVILGSTSHIMAYMRDNPTTDIVIGHADFYSVDEQGEIRRVNIQQPVGRLRYRDFMRIGKIGWPSPEVSFARRRVFEQFGGYDTQFHYLAYLDLWLRFAKVGVRFHAIPELAAKRYLTPDSDTIKAPEEIIQQEMISVLKVHGDLLWWARYRAQQAVRPSTSLLQKACHRFGLHPMRAIRKIASKVTASQHT